MSLQVFLQAQLIGVEEFLTSFEAGVNDISELAGRCAWLGLISEILPLALLAELNFSRMLVGSSGGEQFLLVLPDESIPAANDFLARAAAAIGELSGGTLRLIWAGTENLGPWPVVRKRLDEALHRQSAAPLDRITGRNDSVFEPLAAIADAPASEYFRVFGEGLPASTQVCWSPDQPARLEFSSGKHVWILAEHAAAESNAIAFPRRFAQNEAGSGPATLPELGALAEGTPAWGILRGDVDHFAQRLQRATTVEEHILFSVLFKEFFAGELSVLCTMPEFWRKVSVLYRGGDDFAVFGAWDALLALARELERVFGRFAEQHLKSLAGLEGKSVSMALALAGGDSSAVAVFEQAGAQLLAAKAAETGTFCLFGRTLEWKRVDDAEELKTGLARLVNEFGFPPDSIRDIASVYREAYSTQATRRGKAIRVEKPWRTFMRLSRLIPPSRSKELANLRSSVITNLVGKSTANLKLRPSSRVGLEWARLATGS